MLTHIEIENINSIESCVLSFDKAKYQYKDQFILNDKVANPIAFYGANGSGKSSFVEAIGHLVGLLINDKDKLKPYIPNLANKEKESRVRVDFELENFSFSYSITTDFEGIIEELLIINNSKVLMRTRDSYLYNNTKYEISKGCYPALREVSNKINNSNRVYKAYDYLANIAVLYADRKTYCIKSFLQVPYMDIMVDKSEEARALLRQYKSFPIYDIKSRILKTGDKRYTVNIKRGSSSFEIPFELISSGMESQSLLLTILLSLPKDGVLIVDELETALHPLTMLSFIDVAVKRGIQIIFSSHNTSILSKLRPDNVIFANWKNGNSSYHRLSDIYPNIREVNNIEKMYLSSTFDEEIEK